MDSGYIEDAIEDCKTQNIEYNTFSLFLFAVNTLAYSVKHECDYNIKAIHLLA